MKLTIVLFTLLLCSTVSSAQTVRWAPSSGPSLYMNRVYSLFESDGYLLAGSDSGLARSTDRGLHWKRITAGLQHGDTSVKVESMIEGKNGRLYLTLTSWFNIPFGLYTSSDLGTTWQKLPPAVLDRYLCLARDSDNRLYIGTASNGAFLSSDDGKTWHAVHGSPYQEVHSIQVGPSGIVYAIIDRLLYQKRQTDTGWSVFSTYPSWVHSFTFDNQGRLIVSQDSEIYRVSEAGDHWDTLFRFKNHYLYASAIRTAGTTVIVEDGERLNVSRDNGATWSYCDSIMPYHAPYGITIGPSGTLYVGGEEAEVFRSDDTGRSWIDINNSLPQSPISAVAFSDAGYVFAGGMGQNSGRTQLYRTSDNGATWTGLGYPPNAMYANMCVTHDGMMLVPMPDSGYVVSRDNGQTWSRGFLPTESDRVLCFATSMGDTLIAGSGSHVYVSFDSAQSWRSIKTFAPASWVLALAYGRNGNIWVSRKDSSVCRTTDLGVHWEQYNPRTVPSARKFAVDSSGNVFLLSNIFHYGLWRHTASDTWAKVYDFSLGYPDVTASKTSLYIYDGSVQRSTDLGKTWTPYITNQAPQVSAPSIFADPKGYLWGVAVGVFRSDRSETSSNVSASSMAPLFNVYPNPARGNVHITAASHLDGITLTDVDGRPLRSFELEHETTDGVDFDTRSIPAGTYFIRVVARDKTEVRPVEIIH